MLDVSASDAVLGGERECGLAAVGDLAGDAVEVGAGERPLERAGDVAVVLAEVHEVAGEAPVRAAALPWRSDHLLSRSPCRSPSSSHPWRSRRPPVLSRTVPLPPPFGVYFDGHETITMTMDHSPGAVLSPVDRGCPEAHFVCLAVDVASEVL
jgi:hypothetical protein